MKLTKAKLKAFEAEDREIIQQTEADIKAGRLEVVSISIAERRAIAKAAREAAVRYKELRPRASGVTVTVHVKPKTSTVKPAKTRITVKSSAKLVARKSGR